MATQLALAGLSYLPGGGLLISTVNTASSTTTSVIRSAWTGRPSTSTTRRTSASTFFARSPSVGSDDSSLESSSSLLAPCTPPPPATSPPLRPLMLSTLRQHRTAHTHHHQQRSSVIMGGPDVMMLGTTCSGCGTHVQVQVPPWMLSAIEGSQQRYSDTWRDDPDHHHHDSSSGPLAAGGARAPRIEGQQPYRRPRQIDWRSTFVHTAIGTAHAIKASPIPGLILTFFRAMFAFALLLDARFSLHQRAAIILSRFLEGLVEIEKEVGVMRGAGEALSIGWEATVKGIIAFAKADSFANAYPTHDQPRKSSQPTTSIFTRQQQQQRQPSSQHHSREQAPSSYFPPYHQTRTNTTKPVEPAPSFGTSGDYPRHVFAGVLADSEEDEHFSTSSPRLGVDLDYSHETSCPPSPPPPPSTSTAHGRSEMAHPHPLRRTPMSSPALQSAYLAHSEGNASSRNPAGLPTSASATFGASSSSMMPSYPFLASSSPTDTLLPPYDVAAAAAATGRATKPHPLHHSAVAGSSSYDSTDGGGGALYQRHHRSRSGPGNTQGGDGSGGGLYLEPRGGEPLSTGGAAMPGPPPPSPAGSRAGWAGKAMLGLAERMKVI